MALMEVPRLTCEVHPENRPEEKTETGPLESAAPSRPAGFFRFLAAVWIGAAVGSLLTVLTVAAPLGAGETAAALAMIPLVGLLIGIVTAWIAACIYFGFGTSR